MSIFKKLFFISVYQNDLKTLKILYFKQKKSKFKRTRFHIPKHKYPTNSNDNPLNSPSLKSFDLQIEHQTRSNMHRDHIFTFATIINQQGWEWHPQNVKKINKFPSCSTKNINFALKIICFSTIHY
jgi:hypothetical protein